MGSLPVAVAYDTDDPRALAAFWGGMLGRDPVEDGSGGALLPGADGQLGLRFLLGPAPALRHRMHLHVTSEALADQERVLATALALGAAHADVGQRADEAHVVLRDPGGYAFCVIEPDNAFLAGCGPLGELTCDGSRGAGLFWHRVLGWPLVWDHGDQTAIQSPSGGTKVSWDAWPQGPGAAGARRAGQRLEIAPRDGDLAAAVEHLVRCGASRAGTDADGAMLLTDPDGSELRLLTAVAPS